MALSCKVGTLALTTGTSNVTSASLGFTPKAVITFGVKRTSAGVVNECGMGFGAFTGATERCAVAGFSDDAAATSNTSNVIRDDGCFTLLVATDATDGIADGVSLDADTFTIIPDDAFVGSYLMGFMALGGADLQNAQAGVISVLTGTGNEAYTPLDFQPDCILFFWGGPGTINTVAAQCRFGIGWVNCITGDMGALNLTSQDNQSTAQNTYSLITSSMLAGRSAVATGLIADELTWVSRQSNGFTLNKVAASGGYSLGYLALQGCQVKVGTFATRTDTNDQPVTGVGFTPKALLALTAPPNTGSGTTTGVDHLEGCMGASDGTNMVSLWTADEDNLATSDNYSRLSTTRFLIDYDKETGGTLEGDSTLKSFDSDGFTLDMQDADVAALYGLYLALGDASVTAAKAGVVNPGIVKRLVNGGLVL